MTLSSTASRLFAKRSETSLSKRFGSHETDGTLLELRVIRIRFQNLEPDESLLATRSSALVTLHHILSARPGGKIVHVVPSPSAGSIRSKQFVAGFAF